MLKENRIDLQTAVRKTGNWRRYNVEHDPQDPNYIRAFHIPKEDILELASMANTIGFRAYLAMEDTLQPSGTTLLLVAIKIQDGKEVDMIEYEGLSGVYDFTTPCPDSCDRESVLYKGLQNNS